MVDYTRLAEVIYKKHYCLYSFDDHGDDNGDCVLYASCILSISPVR